jgi:signal transduction histidine kinase
MPGDQNHEVFINIAAVIFIFIVVTCLLIFILLFYQRRRFLHKEKIGEMEKQYGEELMKAQLETQEQTLRHFSTELHDNLGALASLIKINLLTIPLNNTDKAAEKIADTADLTRQMIADIKSLSVSLNSDRIARKGLLNALATEVERINKTGQFIAALHVGDAIPVIDNDKAIILYRMMQEILNNMVKHSTAQHITVDISSAKNIITLVLTDDGVGFDMQEKMQHGEGAGLHNLQKRAAMINATLSMQSSPGNGTRIAIELPSVPMEIPR